MKKTLKVLGIVLIVIVICSIPLFFIIRENDARAVKSQTELNILSMDTDKAKNFFLSALTFPFSAFVNHVSKHALVEAPFYSAGDSTTAINLDTNDNQVDNVYESDTVKTDGDYLYYIVDKSVIITDAKSIEIVSKIETSGKCIPEDVIVYNNTLAVMYSNTVVDGNSTSTNTLVRLYDISNKSIPTVIKEYEVPAIYYTSRIINNHLYVLSRGSVRHYGNNAIRKYIEDGIKKDIPLENIMYLGIKSDRDTLISAVDLDTLEDVHVFSYLTYLSNAYISENSIYLLRSDYDFAFDPPVSTIFGLSGILGLYTKDYNEAEDTAYTRIYKLNIEGNDIKYCAKTKVLGGAINRYGLDERNGNLRVALYSQNIGSKVTIFNENLEEISSTEYINKKEEMYSVRFKDDILYFTTHNSSLPIYMVDLSNENEPKVLDNIEIPGYTTYIMKYDETHIIGIGMKKEETVEKNVNGEIISTHTTLTGMKMALFDISDKTHPVKLYETDIGNSKTASNILENPKGIIFSKEGSFIAIPVYNYDEDFKVDVFYSDSEIDSYSYNNTLDPITSGYVIYSIDLDTGFSLKGSTTSNVTQGILSDNILRGVYLNNNIYSISNDELSVYNINTLKLVKKLNLIEN